MIITYYFSKKKHCVKEFIQFLIPIMNVMPFIWDLIKSATNKSSYITKIAEIILNY